MKLSPEFTLISSNPMARQPQVCSYGFYMVKSLSQGGSQGFYWFRHEIDALAYLYECIDDSSAWDELDRLKGLIKHAEDVPIDEINELQTKFSIRWIGHCEMLLTCQSRFAKEIRNDFSDLFVDSCSDMKERTLEAFWSHLEVYSIRFPEKTFVSNYTLRKPCNWL